MDARDQMAIVFQQYNLFQNMTVLENVMVGQHARSRVGMAQALLRLPAVAALADRFRFVITPYYASLMDPEDPACPIRRQVVPRTAELDEAGGDLLELGVDVTRPGVVVGADELAHLVDVAPVQHVERPGLAAPETAAPGSRRRDSLEAWTPCGNGGK